jgi:flagellar basal body rod protein FlgB
MTSNIVNDLKTAMIYANEQEKTIAGNIAKANMPGAKAFILPPLSLKGDDSKNGKLNMSVTSANHINKSGNRSNSYQAIKMSDTFETTPDGNNINLVQQNLLLSEATMQNKLAIEGYKKYHAMLKTSISSK